jgi:hypothetical protein
MTGLNLFLELVAIGHEGDGHAAGARMHTAGVLIGARWIATPAFLAAAASRAKPGIGLTASGSPP